jgi:hypothetical protein
VLADGSFDDARGHGLAQPERVTDGQHVIPNRQPVTVAQRYGGQVVAVDLHHGNVGQRVAPDQARPETPLVLGRHLDPISVLDDVVVRQHIAVARIDDDARAGGLGLALNWPFGNAEETAEKRIGQQRIVDHHLTADGDVDHCRRHLPQHRGQGRHGLVARDRHRRLARSDRHRLSAGRRGGK